MQSIKLCAPDLAVIPIPRLWEGDKVTAAALSSRGLLALATAGGRVFMVDSSLKGSWTREAGSKVSRLTFSYRDGALAAMTADGLITWDTKSDAYKKIPMRIGPQSLDFATAFAISPGAQMIALATRKVKLIDGMTGEMTRVLEPTSDDAGPYEALAFTPDGAVVAAGGRRIDAWEIDSGTKIEAWSCQCQIESLSRNAYFGAVGTADAEVLLYSVRDARYFAKQIVSEVVGDHVYAPAVDEMGHIVAGTAEGSIVMWNPWHNHIAGKIKVADQPIQRIAISSDARTFLVEAQKAQYERGNYDRWLVLFSGSWLRN